MSTLKVTNIESPSGGGVNAKITDINGGQLSNRNLIYNGAMTVSQRGTSGSTTSGGSYPSLDRWSCNDGGIADFTVSQSTDAPAGFANSAKWACTATGSPTNDAFHEQKLEGQDIQHLEHGTSSAKSFTVSFWVKSNKTGQYSLWIENNDANRYFTTTGYTINAANTWEFKTITVPGDTAGSGFTNDNGVSLKIRWHLVLRTSFQGTPSGAWSTSASLRGQSGHVNLADSTSNEWYITGVQAELGEVATAFEHRSYSDELARCQRYFETSYPVGTAPGATQTHCPLSLNAKANQFRDWQDFKVTKRAVPTMKFYSPDTGTVDKFYNANSTSELTAISDSASHNGARVSTNSTAAVGDLIRWQYTAEAEL